MIEYTIEAIFLTLKVGWGVLVIILPLAVIIFVLAFLLKGQ